MAIKLSSAGADAMLSGAGVAGLLNSGLVRIYSGTEPSSTASALSGNTLLAEAVLGSPAFGTPATSGLSRIVTANAIAPEDVALATGTATFFRATTSAGVVVLQGDVGTGTAATLRMASAALVFGGPVKITAITLRLPTTSVSQNPVNVLDYGVVGDGVTDNATAFQTAFDAAMNDGLRPVYIPAGVYRYSANIGIYALRAFGDGDNTVLYPTNSGNRAFFVRGNGAGVSGMRFLTDSTGRDDGILAAAIVTDFAVNFLVEYVTVERSAGAGIFVHASSNGVVRKCSVVETRADGIRVVNNTSDTTSHDVTVEDCLVERTGGDGISCTTINMHATPNYNILFQRNSLMRISAGRGLSCNGGRDVQIINNHVSGGASHNAAIAIMADSGFNGAPNWNVTVSGNTIKDQGGSAGGPGAIWVMNQYGTVNSLYDNHHITVDQNDIYAARGDAIRVMGLNTRDITLTNNGIYDPVDVAVNLINNPTNVTNTGNPELTLAAYPGDKVSPGNGSGGALPVSVDYTIVVTLNGDIAGGQNPVIRMSADGLWVRSDFDIPAVAPGAQMVKTVVAGLSLTTEQLTFQFLNPGSGRNIYILSVVANGQTITSGTITLSTSTPVSLNLPN